MGVTGTFTGKEGLRPGNDTIHNRIQDRLFGPVGSNSGSCETETQHQKFQGDNTFRHTTN